VILAYFLAGDDNRASDIIKPGKELGGLNMGDYGWQRSAG
jgi:hypothetical protein